MNKPSAYGTKRDEIYLRQCQVGALLQDEAPKPHHQVDGAVPPYQQEGHDGGGREASQGEEDCCEAARDLGYLRRDAREEACRASCPEGQGSRCCPQGAEEPQGCQEGSGQEVIPFRTLKHPYGPLRRTTI